jgi:CTP:molybdopterin cytidylyltransferase MocA
VLANPRGIPQRQRVGAGAREPRDPLPGAGVARRFTVTMCAGHGCATSCRGVRLREGNGGRPKPLSGLLGLSLLERSILSCRAAGVDECCVVVGYAPERIIRFIDELEARDGISITVVRNPNRETGTGARPSRPSPT